MKCSVAPLACGVLCSTERLVEIYFVIQFIKHGNLIKYNWRPDIISRRGYNNVAHKVTDQTTEWQRRSFNSVAIGALKESAQFLASILLQICFSWELS